MDALNAAFTLRDATPADCEDIARLVRALAEYEKLASRWRDGHDHPLALRLQRP